MRPLKILQALMLVPLVAAIPFGAGCQKASEEETPVKEFPPPVSVAEGEEGSEDEARTGNPDADVPILESDDPATSDEDLAVMTATELVERATTVFGLDERIRILEAALAKEPDHFDAQRMLLEATERKGMELALQEGRREESKPYLYRAAKIARSLLERQEPLPAPIRAFASLVFYNEACNLTIDNRPDEAIASLREAVALGFNNPIIHTDEELDAIRDRDDFRELLKQIPGGSDAPAEPPAVD